MIFLLSLQRAESRRAITTFLQGPDVSVRIGEIREAGIVTSLGIQTRAPPSGPRLDRILVPNRADSAGAWTRGDNNRAVACILGCPLHIERAMP